MTIPKTAAGLFDWKSVSLDDIYNWIHQVEDMRPGDALIEQAAVYGYLSSVLAKIEALYTQANHLKEDLEQAKELRIRIVKEEQEERLAVVFAQQCEAVVEPLTARLERKPSQPAIEAEAKRTAPYLQASVTAREARVASLTDEQLDTVMKNLIDLQRQRDQLKGLLRALEHRRDGLRTLSYIRSKEADD